MHQEYVTSFFGTASIISCETKHNSLLDLSDYRFSIFFFYFLSEMFLFFHDKDNGILVEYAYSRWIFNTAHLHFITAHSNLITAQMGSVTPLF